MTTLSTPVHQVPAIDRREAAVLAAAENARFVDLVQSLDAERLGRSPPTARTGMCGPCARTCWG